MPLTIIRKFGCTRLGLQFGQICGGGERLCADRRRGETDDDNDQAEQG
ncbi:MAG: hypothetical protein M5R38_07285 [Candidatus Methylomirabilis sp.]|nr:hypothetical protein [Candidatus Methylomirabilis sp.]